MFDSSIISIILEKEQENLISYKKQMHKEKYEITCVLRITYFDDIDSELLQILKILKKF